MKKLITAIILAALFLTLCSCADKSSGGESKVNDMALNDIIDAIYEKHPMEIATLNVDVDLSDSYSLKSFTGLDSADGIEEAVASEAAINAQAYSLVLVRLKDPSKASDISKAMKEGIDQRKWICVEADDLQVAASGNVVMLVMIDSQYSDSATAAQLVDAFKSVAGSLSVE